MQKLSDLAKTIQEKTSEQAKITDKIVITAFQEHEQNLKDSLKQSELSMKTVLEQRDVQLHNQIAKTYDQSQTSLEKWTKLKEQTDKARIVTLVIISSLITVMLILIGGNYWLGKSIASLYAEKMELEQQIEKTPTERKILAKIDYQEEKGIIYLRTKKAAEAKTDSEGRAVVLIKK